MNENAEYEFNPDKNVKLKQERNISFEEIIYYISNGCLLDTIEHPNREKYSGQQFYVVDVDGYVYLVPFVENEEHIFLKTIFPSRKLTKLYLKEMLDKKMGNKND